MKTHPKEVLVFHNPTSSSDRKTVAHAQGISNHVKTYAFDKAPLTGTNWRTILKNLDRHPKEIMNKAHPYYQENIRGREFNQQGWLNILQHKTELIKAPIAIRGQQVILCETPTDIYRLIESRRQPPV